MMMKKSLLTILCVLLSTMSWAQGTAAGDSTAVAEPYAVLSENNTVLTFYYDENKTSRNGMSVEPVSGPYAIPWYDAHNTITNVVFEPAFGKCTTLTSTANWFYECTALTSISGIEYLNTSNVTDMHQMFLGCSSLTSLILDGLNTSNVTNMNSMFVSCSALTQLGLDINTENVTDMGYMFRYCGALTSLDLSSFNTAKVTEMEYIFYDCSQVTTIYAGSGWINNPDIHANDMFHGCSSLVGGAGTTFDSRYTSYAYAHIDGGTDNPGYFTDKNASYNEAYGVLVIDENNTASLTMYYDANRDAHREGQVIGLDEMMQNQAWMMYRENVTTVVFDSSFAECRPTSTAFWFAYCRSLTSIVGLQYLRTDETTNMSFMFNECSSLTSLDLSSLNTENVTNISGMLGGCRSLTSVDLSGFNTRQVTNMNSLFEQSAALTTINLSSFNTSQVTDMSYMFNECSALTTIYVGSDWSTEAVTNGTDMFNKCTNLVGGAGTTFSADHIDHTYARIDAEGTPGYLTGDGTKPSETVSAPIFAFDGDNLSMTTETANASIFYKMEELPTMDEAYVDSVSNSLIVTPDGQQSTYYERPFELKKSASVKAIAVIDTQAGTIASDTTTLVYDYAAWQNLLTAIEKGSEIYELAKDNSNVETSLKEQLQWALQEGNMLYRERAMMNSFEATHFAQRINELSAQVQAQMSGTDEPYAVLSDNNTVLTFYYDKQKSARGGMSVGPFSQASERGWDSNKTDITNVVFDDSFVNATNITSTAYWFSDFSSLTEIRGIGNLNTTNVTTMAWMFFGCTSLTSIDVSGFNTAAVTDMTYMFMRTGLTSLDISSFRTNNVTQTANMFRGCFGITTIYVGSDWNMDAVTSGTEMFLNCSNLVGGAGTTYSADHTDYTYAHIDGGTANPGYFTDKNATPTEKVATPTFSWSENTLTISSETQGAEIYFALDTARVAMLVPTNYSNSADEKAAVDWFVKNYVEKGLGELYTPYNNVENLIDRGYSACWVMSDRVGTQQGADNLPGYLGGSYVTNILRRFAEKGGNLLLTNHATQLVSSVGRIAANYAPNIFVSGEGGQNPDVWGIHPVIGNEEGKIYDHRDHPIYANMIFDANTDGGIYPLDGPGIKGDHNSMWNLYDLGLSTEPSVVQNWEETTNSTILGTWNNSLQSSTAGVVDFAPTTNFAGRVLAIGIAAYEWDLGGATNTYQSQLEQFTKNCLTYLGGPTKISDDKYQRYTAPVSVTKDCTIYAYAKKDGMATSDTITLVYPYTAWSELLETCYLGQEVVYRASRSPRVPEQLVAETEARIAYCYDFYNQRTAEKQEIEDMTDRLRAELAEIEKMMQVPASYSNYVLTASEDATMAEIADQYSYYGNQVAAIVWNSSVPMTESDLQNFTSNPNLLIYAQSDSLVPTNRNNVVINGVAKNVVLTSAASSNCNFYAPQAFTAEAIQYTRTFSQQTQIGVSRGWEAIALPFTVQTYTHADKGVIAPFGNSASENHFWLRELTENGLQAAQTIEANKPYIISMPNSEEYRPETNLAGQVTFSALNATVPVTEATPVEYGSIALVPTFQTNSHTGVYALNVGEERDGHPEGSVFERNYRAVRPFEAYTEHRDNQNPAPQFIMIGGDMGNGTTGIEELVDKRMNTNDSWYTIDGRRLQGAPAGKGLYIRNGKKVIVR